MKTQLVRWLIIFLLAFVVGFLRQAIVLADRQPASLPGQFLVTTANSAVGRSVELEVKGISTGNKLTVITQTYHRYKYGDLVKLEGKVERGRVYYPQITLLKSGQGNPILSGLHNLRQLLSRKAVLIFGEPYAGLVSGIVFGIQTQLGEEIEEKMIQAGLIHVLVASGYNVSVVIGFVAFLVRWVSTSKRFQVVLTTLLILGYAVIAGLSPPIVRASIIGFATLLAVILGRQKHSFLWLIYSAWIMLLIKPALYSSLSFQLSFAATLGILLFQPLIEKLMYLFPAFLREEGATTVAVVLLVMPLIWLEIGRVSPNTVLVNLLTIWLVPLVMAWSAAAIVIGFLSLGLAKLVAIPVYVMLEYILWIVEVVVN